MEHEQVPGPSDVGAVLVVDDEPSLRAAYCRILQASGHSTVSARDGQEALAMLAEHTIWLVLADLRMPRLDGLGLLREVKRRAPVTQVVLISGYATMDSAIEAMRLGASDYLLKPFSADALEAIVRRLKPSHDRPPATLALLGALEGALQKGACGRNFGQVFGVVAFGRVFFRHQKFQSDCLCTDPLKTTQHFANNSPFNCVGLK